MDERIRMSLLKWFKGMPTEITQVTGGRDYIDIQWIYTGLGFGEFRIRREGDKYICDSECMSKEFVKEILELLGDTIELSESDQKHIEESKRNSRQLQLPFE
jgi:hypothetical protein